jgi:carbon-monoxide dehydrogenase medium subunit
MGTIGGSISFADPGLDYPPALVAAAASIEIASARGRRTMPVREFFTDWYTTALAPGEIVTAVELPAARDGAGVYLKHARVPGDYATVSIALSITRTSAGWQTSAAVGACGPTPLASDEANKLLSGAPSSADITRAGALLQSLADPVDDVRGTAEYRRMLIPRMLVAAMAQASAELGANRG